MALRHLEHPNAFSVVLTCENTTPIYKCTAMEIHAFVIEVSSANKGIC